MPHPKLSVESYRSRNKDCILPWIAVKAARCVAKPVCGLIHQHYRQPKSPTHTDFLAI